MEWYPVNYYAITAGGYQLVDGYPVSLVSEHLAKIDTIDIDQLENYPVVDVDKLKTFIGDNYGRQDSDYYGSVFGCGDGISTLIIFIIFTW